MKTLELEIVNENLFILKKDKTVESLGYSVTVKKGFDFDGASIPKWLWSIYGSPLNGNYVVASLIHDGLYASQLVSKIVADNIFLDLMKQSKVGRELSNKKIFRRERNVNHRLGFHCSGYGEQL